MQLLGSAATVAVAAFEELVFASAAGADTAGDHEPREVRASGRGRRGWEEQPASFSASAADTVAAQCRREAAVTDRSLRPADGHRSGLPAVRAGAGALGRATQADSAAPAATPVQGCCRPHRAHRRRRPVADGADVRSNLAGAFGDRPGPPPRRLRSGEPRRRSRLLSCIGDDDPCSCRAPPRWRRTQRYRAGLRRPGAARPRLQPPAPPGQLGAAEDATQRGQRAQREPSRVPATSL